MSAPRKAPSEIRHQILDALQDPGRRFLDLQTASRRLLDLWGITENGFFAALADDLRRYEIFLKPKGKPSDPQRYQTRLIFEADPLDSPDDLVVHVTLSPKGDPIRVKVALHRSDTVQQIPKLEAKPPKP